MTWLADRAVSLGKAGRVTVAAVRDASAVDEKADAEHPYHLTDREVEVLALLAEGLTNKAIGEQLFVSPRTVSTHVSNLLAKLGVSNRGEAGAAYRRLGIGPTIDLRDPADVTDPSD